MTKEEFDLWVSGMYNKFHREKRLDCFFDCAKGICVVYATDTYESAVLKYDNGNETIAIATAYAKLKGIEIPTIEETPTPWRAENKGRFYYVNEVSEVTFQLENYTWVDNEYYESANYFRTREQAESARKKIKHLLKLQRLHDMLCPDYEPDWSLLAKSKISIIYNEKEHCYYPTSCCTFNNMSDVYFTKEAAEKACKILNKEKEND